MKISEAIENDDAGILIVELLGNDPSSLISQLSNFNSYLSEFQKITSDKRKIEFLSVRIALNILMKNEVKIVYNAVGKPYLLDDETFISVSHTRNYVAVMAGQKSDLGIDIEHISDIERFRKVSGRFLSKEELNDLSIDLYPEILPICWSIEEAVYKMIGEETVNFADKMKIQQFIPENEGLADVFLPDRNQTIAVRYRKNELFTLAWCVAKT